MPLFSQLYKNLVKKKKKKRLNYVISRVLSNSKESKIKHQPSPEG